MFQLDQQIVVGGVCILVALVLLALVIYDFFKGGVEAEDCSVSDVCPTKEVSIRVHGADSLAHD